MLISKICLQQTQLQERSNFHLWQTESINFTFSYISIKLVAGVTRRNWNQQLMFLVAFPFFLPFSPSDLRNGSEPDGRYTASERKIDRSRGIHAPRYKSARVLPKVKNNRTFHGTLLVDTCSWCVSKLLIDSICTPPFTIASPSVSPSNQLFIYSPFRRRTFSLSFRGTKLQLASDDRTKSAKSKAEIVNGFPREFFGRKEFLWVACLKEFELQVIGAARIRDQEQ